MSAPLITPLPPAPQRTDPPVDFSAKADLFVAALSLFQSEANAQASHTNEKATETDANATAAVGAAATAATDAGRAETAREQAEIAAAAAGASAGLPSLVGNGDRVLKVNAEANGVLWGDLDTSYLRPSENLSDLPSASTARTNLGLGNAALRTVGVAAGDQIPDRAAADARYSPKQGLFGTQFLYRQDQNTNQGAFVAWDGTYFRLYAYDFTTNFQYATRVSYADSAGNANSVGGLGVADFDFRYLRLSDSQANIGGVVFAKHRANGKSIAFNELVSGVNLDYAFAEDTFISNAATSAIGFGTWQAAGAASSSGGRVALNFRRVG